MGLLEVENLSVAFPSAAGMARAVDGVSLSLSAGEVLGVVGESGAGKSLTMLAVMGLVPHPAQVTAGRLTFKGRDLAMLSRRERRALSGKSIAMIFQEPTTSLNPSLTIGFQLIESLRVHERMGRTAARRRAVGLLEQVGIPAAEERIRAFPHQLSGGMNQRVMIAMAIACNPDILIADEPTTALDVTIQAQILALLVSLQRDRGMGLILVTHNMDVVAETAQRVAVMYAGQIVEEASTAALFQAPQHPYTAALLAARPIHGEASRLATIPGTPPGLLEHPPGCLFGPRCAYATERARAIRPELRDWMGGKVRCHYPLGDRGRDARIAADGLIGAKAGT
ncbi:MAG TPA: ABC transporter ATP-binding protein [Xanthobacteraceae bacterium]